MTSFKVTDIWTLWVCVRVLDYRNYASRRLKKRTYPQLRGWVLTAWISWIYFIENDKDALKYIYVFSIYEGGLSCLGLRKFPPEIRKWFLAKFSKYWGTFQTAKKQVELKILSMVHRCQKWNEKIYNKRFLNQGEGGMDHWGHFLTFFTWSLEFLKYYWSLTASSGQ